MGLTTAEVLSALVVVAVGVLMLSSERMVRAETLKAVLEMALVVVVAVVAHMQFLISSFRSAMIART
jgi:hypothetical protein